MNHREIEGGVWQLTGKVSRPHTRMSFGARVWLGLDEDTLIKGVRISDGICDKIWMRFLISKINRGGGDFVTGAGVWLP